jgi:UDP-glucose 4-epimerase
MHVLITGANGFLGAHVVRACLARSHRVRVLVRPHTDLTSFEWQEEVDVFRADLREHPRLVDAFTDIDVLVHLAAQVSGDDDEQFDAIAVATERLIDAMARSATRRMVLASSFSVYDWGGASGVLDESVAFDPRLNRRGGYAVAKIWQERIVRRAAESRGWSVAILRPGFIWGRGREVVPGVRFILGPFCAVLGIGRRLPLTHVSNCAECFALATGSGADGVEVYNIVDSDSVTAWRYASEEKRLSGGTGIRIPLPFAALSAVARMAALCSRLIFGANGRLPSMLMPERLAVFRPLRFPNSSVRRRYGWEPQLDFATALDHTFGPTPGTVGPLSPHSSSGRHDAL